MKIFRIFFSLFSILALAGSALAQNEQQPEQRQSYEENYLYQENRFKERTVIPWPFLREADVMWRRRIERMIDPREKANQCLRWPKNPMNEILVRNVNGGILSVYRDDSLIRTYTAEEAKERGTYERVQSFFIDPENPDLGSVDSTVKEPFKPDDIIRYKLIEEWVFDKKHSILRARILAIVPVYNKRNSSGDVIGQNDLYYIKYDDFRRIMVNEQIYNRFNDAMRLTYDDFFEFRLFNSYITKESNVYDLSIKDMEEFEKDGLAALLEADRIRNELFIFEHDLWEY